MLVELELRPDGLLRQWDIENERFERWAIAPEDLEDFARETGHLVAVWNRDDFTWEEVTHDDGQ